MRAPPLLLLLLMAAAGLAVSPLARLNPWLSACDLEEEGASGVPECGGTACGSGGGAAKVLQARDVPLLCGLAAAERARRLADLRLRACCERSPASALDRGARAEVLAGGDRCESTLHDLLRLDTMVAHVHCEFVNILHRYDCEQAYSVHTCEYCQRKTTINQQSKSPILTQIFDWENEIIIFTDEKCFKSDKDGRKTLWRRRRKQYNPRKWKTDFGLLGLDVLQGSRRAGRNRQPHDWPLQDVMLPSPLLLVHDSCVLCSYALLLLSIKNHLTANQS